MSNFKHVAESKPEAFIEKNIGVSMPGWKWVQPLGLLMHILNTPELAQEIFEDDDTYNEMVMVVKDMQKQVLGVQEKILTEGSSLQIEEAPTKKIILV